VNGKATLLVDEGKSLLVDEGEFLLAAAEGPMSLEPGKGFPRPAFLEKRGVVTLEQQFLVGELVWALATRLLKSAPEHRSQRYLST